MVGWKPSHTKKFKQRLDGSGSLDHDPEKLFLALFVFYRLANLSHFHDECLIKPLPAMTHVRRWCSGPCDSWLLTLAYLVL